MVSFGHVAALCKNQGSRMRKKGNVDTKEVINSVCSAPLIRPLLRTILKLPPVIYSQH